mmetsp:Transcript_7762/g.19210  ORF Transcript_7762/g.19210 Transcript_7762/m.19210 type:complete len:230 (+) Transcript_7762:227-916(+)
MTRNGEQFAFALRCLSGFRLLGSRTDQERETNPTASPIVRACERARILVVRGRRRSSDAKPNRRADRSSPPCRTPRGGGGGELARGTVERSAELVACAPRKTRTSEKSPSAPPIDRSEGAGTTDGVFRVVVVVVVVSGGREPARSLPTDRPGSRGAPGRPGARTASSSRDHHRRRHRPSSSSSSPPRFVFVFVFVFRRCSPPPPPPPTERARSHRNAVGPPPSRNSSPR